MLKSTFQHLRGVGKKKEALLWQAGVTSWERYRGLEQFSLFGGFSGGGELSASFEAYSAGDVEFFASALPHDEHYRIALEYPDQVLFLDIETTGLSLYYDSITLVGWDYAGRYDIYVSGTAEDNLISIMSKAKVLVTFNGTMFDLKFLLKRFPGLRIPPVHVDLRYLAKRVGLSGGQKAIERELNFRRTKSILGLDGEGAPILWHKYRRGSLAALKKLIRYNHADIEGMRFIFDHCVRRLTESMIIPPAVRPIPRFAAAGAKLKWANPAELDSGVRVDAYAGDSKPLITYSELNSLHPLDNFCVVGVDLVASEKKGSGIATLRGSHATTCRLKTDDDIIAYAQNAGAQLVSIDSPLSIPEGRTSCWDDDPTRHSHGITRLCERILKRRGINSYPCLINSMQKLTNRGMRLAERFRELGIPVIESYPGAAQDILNIPRKQAGLGYLIESLMEFGLQGEFAAGNLSHDEIDAITSALVGHFFWVGKFEALGNEVEDYLIVPDLNANHKAWLERVVLGFSGATRSGKSALGQIFRREGWQYGRYSDILRRMLAESGAEITRSGLQRLGWIVHQEKGQRWLGRELLPRVTNGTRIVIDGLRFFEDHAFLVERFGPAFVHIHLEADCEIRSQRTGSSADEDQGMAATEAHPVEAQIQALKGVAQQVLRNDLDIDDIVRHVKKHVVR